MKLIYCLMATILLTSTTAMAQEKKDNTDTAKKHKKVLTLGSAGIQISETDTTAKEKSFDVEIGVVDVGVNTLIDNTIYGNAVTQSFLNVPNDQKNSNLFSLQNAKSINVNVWPVLLKWRAVKTEHQKVYLYSGLGLQMYNFRFTKDISYLNKTSPEVYMDSISFSKNKLGFTYLSVPLGFTLKTKLAPKAWLVYGAGITGGYRISSWTKQISGERGKQKNHDSFNFNDFNSCVTGEIGVDGYLRLYVSYQLTSLQKTALDQHPLCIGIRIGGV
ncbi:MAG: hypothetical protein BGO69_00305 [Bacteroidetes bacterium 46-16]|nr:MAG: hypothetical protein BGO69_00305 [Bacteroidetes bacterium 46-16]